MIQESKHGYGSKYLLKDNGKIKPITVGQYLWLLEQTPTCYQAEIKLIEGYVEITLERYSLPNMKRCDLEGCDN